MIDYESYWLAERTKKERLEFGLRMMRAILNQPIQFCSLGAENVDWLNRKIKTLQSDCKTVREFIDELLCEPNDRPE